MIKDGLTGYGEDRIRRSIDLLTTLHGLLNENKSEAAADEVADVLDLLYGQCRPDLRAIVVVAANAPWRTGL